ncbi:Alpha/Beta hydrolase protein [Radiomyces spectabilis]|uniref:Alpha/Beta hydrolase protein n=1 Tax=Radiomyces spectabilis TaxID=64574 RepID=UPI002220D7D9|nr:Alpha/Beta hydrolase protein [Radiomyces spectabilis]KAI8384757.1 Alpha/Beta hydrolase protein [Radiomyces spectabilis]
MGRSSRPKWSIVKKSKESWDDIVERTEDHFVESLEQWRSQVGIEKMTLCGHSMGGYFATCYALKYPDRVRKLILVSPAGIPERPPELGPDPREAPGASPKELLTKEASELAAANDTATMSAEAIAQSNGDPQVLPSPPVRKIPAWAKYLWDKNITPMSIVRFSGPFGASLVNNYASKRFAHLNVDERHDLYDYL